MRMAFGDAVVEVADDQVTGQAPATGKGFSDLVVLTAMAHNQWKVDIDGIDADG